MTDISNSPVQPLSSTLYTLLQLYVPTSFLDNAFTANLVQRTRSMYALPEHSHATPCAARLLLSISIRRLGEDSAFAVYGVYTPIWSPAKRSGDVQRSGGCLRALQQFCPASACREVCSCCCMYSITILLHRWARAYAHDSPSSIWKRQLR